MREICLIYVQWIRAWIQVHGIRAYNYVKGHEDNVVKIIITLIRSRKISILVDIGAYIGFYTLLAAKHGCKVIAFEPDPRSFVLLKNNVQMADLSDRVLCFNIALGDKRGKLKFRLASIPSESSATEYLQNGFSKCMNVSMTTIDDTFERLFLNDVVMLMKIDVEGFGLHVINGALKTIAKFKPIIILEVHRTFSFDDEFNAINLLTKLGYIYEILEFRSIRNFILIFYPHT